MQILWQGKRRGMDGRVVIATFKTRLVEARLNDFGREMTQHLVVGRPRKGHDPAVIGRDRGLVEADVAKVGAQLAVAVEGFILLQEADAVLRDEDSQR
ncbi:MAG: hypothetical protein K0S17_3699 [Enterobacter mori]|nr:hypothetical protein [Enterobacter mori]